MKQKLTSEDISYLVPSLNKILDGCYLTQIYDGSTDGTRIVVMKFRYKSETEVKFYHLLIESGIRMHTIENFESIRPAPSGLVSKLRKEFRDKRIWPIEQIGTDRIVDFKFSNSSHLIIELYDKGNFIVTDENYIISYIIRSYEYNGSKLDVKSKYPIDEIWKNSSKSIIDYSSGKGYIIPNNNFSGSQLEGKNVQEFEDFNSALMNYFKTEIKKKEKPKSKKTERNKNKKGNIESQIEKLTKNEDKQLNLAENFIEKIDFYQEIINLINSYLESKLKNFIEITEIINDMYDIDVVLDHQKLKIDGYEIDYKISAYNNVSKIFSQKKVYSEKKERATKLFHDTKFVQDEPVKDKLIVNRKTHKFEDYWWFIIDDFKILCGKSADDNEKILNNCEKDDVLVHGHFDKSPWAIVKNPNKKEVPIKVLSYTGNFLVHRSWSWIENITNNSYYTYPDKVSKSAPSGEYMGKGSRMVHEKNLLSCADMIASVCILFSVGDTFTGTPNFDDDINYAMVMCCPFNVTTDFIFKTKVKPNGTKKDKGRKKLIETIISKFLKLKIKNNKLKDYIRAIPYDEWDKVCIRTFVLA